MSKNYFRTSCRLCESTSLIKVMPLAPTPIGDAYLTQSAYSEIQPLYPLDLWLCKQCGHTQLLDVISQESLYSEFLYLTRTSKGLDEHFYMYAQDVISRLQKKTLAVDIGSNDGTFLQYLKKAGLTVVGIEPASHVADIAIAEGIPTIADYFTPEIARGIRKKYGLAKFVSTNNTLSNIDTPRALIEGIYDILDIDGLYAIECSYMPDLIDNFVFDTIYHEHLSYFSLLPLQHFLAEYSFTMVDVVRTVSKGGSIRVYAQKTGGHYAQSEILQTMIETEKIRNLNERNIYNDYLMRISVAGDAVRSLLKKLKADGKIVACYGASPSTTTLLFQFGIENLFDFYVDDNLIKIGRFAPVTRIPVYSSDALCMKNPDFVFVAAWRFTHQIIEKNHAYLEQGGTFIIPLPDLRFIAGKI